jgi:hypothetical protein
MNVPGSILGRLGALLLVGLLTGCGSTAQERADGRMRLLSSDLESAHEEWQAALDRQWFRTNAQAMSDLEGRYQRVYARWGLRPDPLTQALLSYGVAVADRVDRRQLSREDANRLYGQMKGDVERARDEVRSQSPEGQAQFELKALTWWKAYWERSRQLFGATPDNPVRCTIVPEDGGGESVTCR